MAYSNQSNGALSSAKAKEKIERYCAYQERCHREVKEKLYSYGLPGYEVDELIAYLITEGFLNEERFAKAFAGGKFRVKKWGRLKITRALELKGVTPYCIKSGLKEIEEEDYLRTLNQLVELKAELTDIDNTFIKRDKIAKYLIQKGYEPDLVWSTLKTAIPD